MLMELFESLFREPVETNIAKILKVASLFLRIVNEETCDHLYRTMILEEILQVIRPFRKDINLGLDGWIVELFIYFFDVLGEDLL